MPSPRHLDVKEVAKAIRKDLKTQFPATTFSVRIDRFSGGSDVHVRWLDGPTQPTVERTIGHWQGVDFDGMQDLKTYRGGFLYNGEYVSTSCWVTCRREYSKPFLTRVLREAETHYGGTAADDMSIQTHHDNTAWIKDGDRTSPIANWDGSLYWSWQNIVYRAANDRTTLGN